MKYTGRGGLFALTTMCTSRPLQSAVYESVEFFKQVSIVEFLTSTQWSPLFADAHYGILPLVSGTVVTTIVALLVAIPLGTITAIYLSEFANPRLREKVSYIACLETGGKLSPEEAYERIQIIWKQLEQCKKELGIGTDTEVEGLNQRPIKENEG